MIFLYISLAVNIIFLYLYHDKQSLLLIVHFNLASFRGSCIFLPVIAKTNKFAGLILCWFELCHREQFVIPSFLLIFFLLSLVL